MGLQPKIETKLDFIDKECMRCHNHYDSAAFPNSKSPLSIDKHSDICGNCLRAIAMQSDYNWEIIDYICQYLNIPFIPAKFEEMRAVNGDNALLLYFNVFQELEYAHLNWHMYWNEFKKLENAGLIDQELPRIKDDRLRHLQLKWGANYSEEQLNYLDYLYKGILSSQNVNGDLQADQAKKLCKTSLEIEERIRAGQDFDKMLTSYEKLVKIADFTPKNAKNAADFDSVGELFHWLEKRGWKNQYYDNVTKDIVDETIKSIQTFNQRLYMNESGIGEEISRRIEALNSVNNSEKTYDISEDFDLDGSEVEAFNDLINNEFIEDLE